jgi:crossover junction endodeoxyribonuclease RuvC
VNILGIDPGLDGGVALVTKDMSAIYEPLVSIDVKKGRILDIAWLRDWLRIRKENGLSMALLEFVAARPGQGVSSTFKFGRTYGQIEGLLVALEIPYQLVTPQQWTKEMHSGVEAGDSKAKSLIAVQRLFPGLNLRATPRSTTAHLGIVDALLIAAYGQRRHGNA